MAETRLIVVSNRLPVVLERNEEGFTARPGSGGLVSALEPILRQRQGLWIGWPGTTEQRGAWAPVLEGIGRERGVRFEPVELSERLVADYYGGFSNAVLWPLFHHLDDRCNFAPEYWHAYLEANRRFAAVVAAQTKPGDFVWVHDYQLIQVADELRRSGAHDRRACFFLHIPFPPLDSFLKLPWRSEVLHGLIAYHVVGFQTERDRRSFLDCVQRLLPQAELRDLGVDGDSALTEVHYEGHVARVGTFPIGVDFPRIEQMAASDEVRQHMSHLRVALGDRAIILGVDRLDYTKGIPERLLAYQTLLERAPELCERVMLLQIVEPSREVVVEYQDLKTRIDQLVGSINGRFGTPGWVPVHYLYRGVAWPQLFALYRISRVALVTPLKDGMNLVAKEYCVCQLDDGANSAGALVLSEFAGAAAQLHEHALVVNPYDVEGTACALRDALALDPEERRRRMQLMREGLGREDVFWWARRFLQAARDSAPPSLPRVDEFVPDLGRDTSPGSNRSSSLPPQSSINPTHGSRRSA